MSVIGIFAQSGIDLCDAKGIRFVFHGLFSGREVEIIDESGFIGGLIEKSRVRVVRVVRINRASPEIEKPFSRTFGRHGKKEMVT